MVRRLITSFFILLISLVSFKILLAQQLIISFEPCRVERKKTSWADVIALGDIIFPQNGEVIVPIIVQGEAISYVGCVLNFNRTQLDYVGMNKPQKDSDFFGGCESLEICSEPGQQPQGQYGQVLFSRGLLPSALGNTLVVDGKNSIAYIKFRLRNVNNIVFISFWLSNCSLGTAGQLIQRRDLGGSEKMTILVGGIAQLSEQGSSPVTPPQPQPQPSPSVLPVPLPSPDGVTPVVIIFPPSTTSTSISPGSTFSTSAMPTTYIPPDSNSSSSSGSDGSQNGLPPDRTEEREKKDSNSKGGCFFMAL